MRTAGSTPIPMAARWRAWPRTTACCARPPRVPPSCACCRTADTPQALLARRLETDTGVRAVAERLVARVPATAQFRRHGAQHGATGAGADFEVAVHVERAVARG